MKNKMRTSKLKNYNYLIKHVPPKKNLTEKNGISKSPHKITVGGIEEMRNYNYFCLKKDCE